MSIAPSALDLRSAAAEAWARQQAEAAERKRQEREHARARLISECRRALRSFTLTYDPFSPLTEADVEAAILELVETADGIPFEATVTFAGERFQYRPTPNSGGHVLWHLHTCTACGGEQVSTGAITSLADLGYWLEEAPKRCWHDEALS